MNRRWLGWMLSLAVVGSLVGCGGGGGSGGEGQTSGGQTGGGEAVNAVEETALNIYRQNCMACHGNELQGVSAPNLQQVGSRYSKEQIAQILHEGRGRMPSFASRLQAEEIDALATWLSEQK